MLNTIPAQRVGARNGNLAPYGFLTRLGVILECVLRVLIAEDEQRLAEAIARGLRREGMAVDLAPDGTDALVKARVVRYDVLVLDRDLPGLHGDDVCRAVRGERPETGILMLTAAGALEDLIEGLALGADDYLPKPFRFAELVARIHALARRASPSRPPVLTQATSSSTRRAALVSRAGQPVELARKEFGVLEVLMDADGATVSAEELLERVWDEHTDPFTNVVRMTIMTLSRKLGEPPVVETVIGVSNTYGNQASTCRVNSTSRLVRTTKPTAFGVRSRM